MTHPDDPKRAQLATVDLGGEIPIEVDGLDTTSGPAPRGVTAALDRDDAIFGHSRRYEPGALLGRGGMGEVRLYKDAIIGREVAIKTLQAKNEKGGDAWRRFVREARVQGQLEHPSIVPVYDFGARDDGEVYLSMRRVQGLSLADVLDQLADEDPAATARWSRRRLLGAFVQVCLAVDYAHSRGVIHRDLKPGNIMLGDFGEVHVIDWGLAQVLAEGDPTRSDRERMDKPLELADVEKLTVDGEVMGTPGYMSPEQMGARPGPMGPATDVFALGMILFEVLTFKRFHRGKRFPAIWALTRQGFVVAPSQERADVPAELDAVCKRAAAIDPAQRYPSARELAEAVDAYLDRESDRARKRDLANAHGQRALATIGSTTHADEAERQRSGLREALAAISLDPTQRDARQALASLLGDVPPTLPAPVAQEIEARFQENRRRSVHSGSMAWLGWLVSSPLALLLGVRAWWVWIVGTLACAVGAGYSAWLRRQREIDGAPVALFAVLYSVALMLFASWLGPFVFVPGVTAVVLFFGFEQARPRERGFLVVLAVATMLVPWGLELAGVIPPSMRVTAGGVQLLPRAFETRPATTTAALVWTSLSFIVIPVRFLGRMRDALHAAERRLALHAWQLRQLVD